MTTCMGSGISHAARPNRRRPPDTAERPRPPRCVCPRASRRSTEPRSCGQKTAAPPHPARDRAHQPDLFEKRGQWGEPENLGLEPVGAATGHAAGGAGVEAYTAILDAVREQVAEEQPANTVEVGDPPAVDTPHVGNALAQAVTRELNVASLLGDVNAHEPLHHWLQFVVIHHLPLQ